MVINGGRENPTSGRKIKELFVDKFISSLLCTGR